MNHDTMTRSASPKRSVALMATVAGVLYIASTAGASITTYTLHNHPDGAARLPLYGLRLDELYNATAGHDIFTFNFDDSGSSMSLTHDDVAGTIVISGSSVGGRDIGASYAADAYLGLYDISFTYTSVVTVPGDDDVWVVSDAGTGSGTIAPAAVGGPSIGGGAIALTPKSDGSFAFRLGDKDNDLGHRGHAGTSGWGWLNVGGSHVDSQDWLFTAEKDETTNEIPEPATLAVLGVGGLTALLRRRRRSA